MHFSLEIYCDFSKKPEKALHGQKIHVELILA